MAEEQISFGSFRCDPANACVWRDEQALSLTPKAFSVLLYLLRHPDRLVSKEELLQTVWAGTYVGEAVLKVSVGEIRRLLADDPKAPQFIETVHRRGYRFIAPLTLAPPVQDSTFKVLPASLSATSDDERADPSSPQLGTWNLKPGTPLVGRNVELQRLHAWLKKARQGDRQIVFVTGEPGIGKTAIVKAFLTQAATDSLLIAHGQCLEHYGAGEAYLPVLEACGRLCREPSCEWLIEFLERYAPTWLLQMPALISPVDRERLQREILGATPERMLREMAEALEALTAEAPLVLVLEDLHWSDYATLDLIAALARRRELARLLVIATYRPVDVIVSGHPLKRLKQELQAHNQCEEIPLDLLTPPDVALYLASRFPGNTLPEALTSAIHRRTDGNPLFLINCVDYLVGQGVLHLEREQWGIQGEIERIDEGIPESIRQMIERQIERLTTEEQRILEAASVAGMEFAAVTVAAALEEQEERVEECCDRLAQQGQFLRVGEPRTWLDGTVTAIYGFTHSLYQNVLAQRVAAMRRIRLHQRIGECLERGYGARTHEIAAELAVHFEQGRDYQRAIRSLQQAAEQAGRRYANREARYYLARALGLVRHLPEGAQENARLALLEQRGLVLRAMGDMRLAADDFSALATSAQELEQGEREVVALSHLATALSWVDREKCLEAEQRAVMLSHKLPNETLRTRIRGYAAYWNLLWRGWRPEDASACALAAETARQSNDLGLLGVHIGRLSFFLSLQAEYEAARQAAEEGKQHTLDMGDAHNHLLCIYFLAWALLHGGRWGEMQRLLCEGIAMAERNGNKPWEMVFRLELAWLHIHVGDFAPTRDVCERGLQLSRELSLPIGQLISPILLGFVHLGAGQPQRALQSWSDLASRLERERLLMDWIWQMPLRLGLSEYWISQKNWEQARHEAEHLCARAAQPGERTYLALGRDLLAEVAMAQQAWRKAETEVAAALAALEDISAPLAEWRVCKTAARLAERRRAKAEAQRYWTRSKSVLLRLAASFGQYDPLRQMFLAQPMIQEVLQTG